MMSYIVPTYLLLQAGLTKQDYEEAYASLSNSAVERHPKWQQGFTITTA